MLIENINMQMEGEIADLLDRRMMSLFGVSAKPPTKLDVQNTSLKLQAAQHVTAGGRGSPDPRINISIDETVASATDVGNRASLTVGLNGTY